MNIQLKKLPGFKHVIWTASFLQTYTTAKKKTKWGKDRAGQDISGCAYVISDVQGYVARLLIIMHNYS